MTDLQTSRTDETTKEDPKDTFSYEFLLARAFKEVENKIQKEKMASPIEKIKIRKPVFLKMSKKRLVWMNFLDFCSHVHRSPDEVQRFFGGCLRVRSYINKENNSLTIKSEVPESHLLGFIGKYVKDVVLCHSCHRLTTEYKTNTRTKCCTVECSTCQASRVVIVPETPCKLLYEVVQFSS